MKRQSPSGNRSILHFFKAVARDSQQNTAATTSTGAGNASPPPNPSGLAPSDPASTASTASTAPTAPTSTTGPSTSSGSNASTVADAPADDGSMTLIDRQAVTTSQTSANSGPSKRVVSRGQDVVLNSDSNSDSGSDSMEDLDFGLPAPKLKIPTCTGRSTRRMGFNEPELRRPPKEGRKNGKRPFSQLMESAQKKLDAEAQILEQKASLERADDGSAPAATMLDKGALKQALNDDDDDSDQADRLYKAMQRTNRVQAQTAYHFFEGVQSVSIVPPLPQSSLPDHGWTACFGDPSTRDQAFMSGFAHQIFRLQELPDELAAWMVDQVCLGHNAALDEKYLEILTAHDEKLQNQLSPKRLDAVFKSIGAKVESLGASEEISPSEAQAHSQQPLPPSLKRVAALLRTAAPCLHVKARTHAFHLLCHTCLDDRVLLDADVLGSVQEAMEAVICQYADNQRLTSGVGSPQLEDVHSLITSQLLHVVPKLLSRITNPFLQANLIHAFPTRSPLTAYLQRHLALSFLFHPTAVDIPLADARLPSLVHAHLETSPHYRTRKGTGHSLLVARLSLLDIAIGPGPTTVPYLPLTSPAASEAGSSPPVAPTPASSEVKRFNKEVDALAQHIKLLGNSIVETGAALDLTVLDAKERCERVYWRLQHAVRIGGKKADNVFGDNEEAKQPKVKSFFRPPPTKNTPEQSVFDEEGGGELST